MKLTEISKIRNENDVCLGGPDRVMRDEKRVLRGG